MDRNVAAPGPAAIDATPAGELLWRLFETGKQRLLLLVNTGASPVLRATPTGVDIESLVAGDGATVAPDAARMRRLNIDTKALVNIGP